MINVNLEEVPSVAGLNICDTVVIGGGITGAAAARALAVSGLSVRLLEGDDFGSGTTSRTSRLQYCGLAYLAGFTQFRDILKKPAAFLLSARLARRSMVERRRFLARSPHRLRPVEFVIPIYADEGPSRLRMAMGMTFMSLLDLKAPLDWELLDQKAAEASPFFAHSPRKITGAIRYTDYQYNWPERVCLDVVQEAETLGALVHNYAPVSKIERSGRNWRVTYRDLRSGAEEAVIARCVLNCAGPWVDELVPEGCRKQPFNSGEKGTNLMVRLSGRFRGRGLQVSSKVDGTFYVIPWGDMHYVGPVNENTKENVASAFHPTEADVARLRDLLRKYLGEGNENGPELLFAWAGTRPRTRASKTDLPSPMPRLHGPKDTGIDGYFVYTGGLLMMHDMIGRECAHGILKWMRRPPQRPSVKSLNRLEASLSGLTRESIRNMVLFEHAWTLEDVLFRRSDKGWESDLGLSAVDQVAEWLGEVLGWDDAQKAASVRGYKKKMREVYSADLGAVELSAQCRPDQPGSMNR